MHFVPCLWDTPEPANRLFNVTFSGCKEVSLTDLAAKLKSEPPLAHQTKLCSATVFTPVLAHGRPHRQVALHAEQSTLGR
jgi:hypothetical protein